VEYAATIDLIDALYIYHTFYDVKEFVLTSAAPIRAYHLARFESCRLEMGHWQFFLYNRYILRQFPRKISQILMC